jgi:hypothetical protein
MFPIRDRLLQLVRPRGDALFQLSVETRELFARGRQVVHETRVLEAQAHGTDERPLAGTRDCRHADPEVCPAPCRRSYWPQRGEVALSQDVQSRPPIISLSVERSEYGAFA